MGSRMNAVVVEADGTWTLRFDRWAAYGTAVMLLDEPAGVLDLLRSWQVADWWYDEVWAEASVLADVRGRELHFFCCCGELMRPVPLRRRYLQLLQACWPGWNVSWAYEGVAGIVELLGLDPGMIAGIPARPPRWVVPPKPRPRSKPVPRCYELVTVRDVAGAVHVHVNDWGWGSGSVLGAGPEALPKVRTAWPGPHPIDLSVTWGCQGGVHVDLGARTVDHWTGHLLPSGGGWRDAWPGLQLRFHEDRYEDQVARCGGAVQAAAPDAADVDAGLAAPLTALFRGDLPYALDWALAEIGVAGHGDT